MLLVACAVSLGAAAQERGGVSGGKTSGAAVPPSYTGGMDSMTAFLMRNVNYPPEAVKKDIEGVVYVSFVVERDGTLSRVSVLGGIGGGCDEEAVRVISSMPRWQPGRHAEDGAAMRAKMVCPVRFTLTGEGQRRKSSKERRAVRKAVKKAAIPQETTKYYQVK